MNAQDAVSKILIADAHPVVRAGYKQFLQKECGATEMGEAASGRETLDLLHRARWDLLILDIQMPDSTAFDLLYRLKSAYTNLRILVMSDLPEEQYALSVLRAGAFGYVSKGSSLLQLLEAVRTILLGRRYISESVAKIIGKQLDKSHFDRPKHAQLSIREFQIFLKLAAGTRVTKIANELELSVKTVSTYRTRILEKMVCTSNTDLTVYAHRAGLVQ